MLRDLPFISFFYTCLIIFFSVAGVPQTVLSASKSGTKQFLSLRHELIKTSKTEEQYTDIILLAKHKLAILHDQLSKIKSQINIRTQKKVNLSKIFIMLSRYPKASPISSTQTCVFVYFKLFGISYILLTLLILAYLLRIITKNL